MAEIMIEQVRAVVREETTALISAAVESIGRAMQAGFREQQAGFREQEEHLKSQRVDFETELLKAFHGYARAQTSEVRALCAAEQVNEIRIAALEERMLNLETRGGE